MTASLLAGLAAMAGDSPLWLRNPAISPDGQTVAFTYRGDVYTVPVTGGQARQLTTDSGYDTAPVWSPDGKHIAFASDRRGSLDVYLMPAAGGTAHRLTTDTGREKPLAFLNDSTLIFSGQYMGSPQTLRGPFVQPVYSVSTHGGRPHLWQDMNMMAIAVGPDGQIAYQDRKGYEDVLRKHEHSSGTADIWTIDAQGRHHKVTSFDGQDQSPVWNTDGTLAYVSEQDGTLNVWTSAVDGTGARQLTHFTDNPVRTLTAANNGTMAFSQNGELYTMRPGAEPQRLDVTIVADDYDADLLQGLRSSGATQMDVSPDGKQVAFVLRGDVYVTSTKYKTTKRITDTPGQERGVSFSPDGRSLVYDSERDGLWQLFEAKPADPAQKNLVYATDIVESPLYKSDKPAQWPQYSPDGKKVAFLEDRTELRVIDLKTKAVNTALDGKYNYSYSDGDVTFVWSPDSRWFLTDYIGTGGWNNTDVALVKADGTEVIDLTESGYSDSNPRFAMGGRAVTYTTGRYGMKSHGSWGEQSDVVVMMLDGDAWDEFNRTDEEAELAKEADNKDNKDGKDEKDSKDKKAKKDKDSKDKADKKAADVKPLVFDLDNRHFRTRRITGASSSMGDYWLNNDGTKLYYTDYSATGGPSLMERDLRKGETKVLVPHTSGAIYPTADGDELFLLGRSISKVKLADGKKDAVEFEAEYDRHPSLEREYIYDHMLRQVADKFHDVGMHGTDWQKHGDNYRRFLPHINNNYDFAELLSEILGELNASHTGGRYSAPSPAMTVASLGAFFDQDWNGDGLRVAEVIKRGPLSDKKADIHAGDIITEIDGKPILAGADWTEMLLGKQGKPVRLTVRRDGQAALDNVTVKPISGGQLRDLLYHRWVERNEALVDSLSGGRLGYVHIQGMDSPSFRQVYSKLLGKYRNREAVVVDTRWNGGGWLHNDIALLLGGKEYVRYTPRGRYIGSDPFSQWTKPSVMLVNESNYSDAHGTPYVYQTLGLGDIVGAPIPGTMTAVWWETQIDPTLVFGIPQVSSIDVKGDVLENKQLNPDVLIYNNPDDVVNGRDAQLEGAVRTLLDKLDK